MSAEMLVHLHVINCIFLIFCLYHLQKFPNINTVASTEYFRGFGLVVVAFVVLLVSLSFGGGMFVDFCLGFSVVQNLKRYTFRFFTAALQGLVKTSSSRQENLGKIPAVQRNSSGIPPASRTWPLFLIRQHSISFLRTI